MIYLRNNILLKNNIKRYFSYDNGETYNKRWHYSWTTSSYTAPPNEQPTRKKNPEELKEDYVFGSVIRDFKLRILPGINNLDKRYKRILDPFNMFILPSIAFGFFQLWPYSLGFKLLTLIPLGMLYTRSRDKVLDPNLKETYLREIIYTNEELKKYFKDETTHVMDFKFEYVPGLDFEKFPELNNKYFKLFNADSNFCEGYFVFGDLESNVTMKLDFKTMPVGGRNRFMPEEPYFYYDIRAQLNINGEFKEVIIVDEKETLKKYRPFLLMI